MTSSILEPEFMEQTLAGAAGKLLSAGPLLNDSPAWIQAMRSSAWERFEGLPSPQRTDETWRFSNARAWDLSAYCAPLALPPGAGDDLVARSRGLDQIAGRMVFGNDHLLSREAFSAELREKGVLWLPLEEAFDQHAELVRKHFMREDALLGSQKFAALHQSQARAGTFLYVPRGVEVALPLETFHWMAGQAGACFPHTLIIAEERSKVTLVDYLQSADPGSEGFACGVSDLWLGAGAQVTSVCVQEWSSKTRAFQINSAVVGRDARAIALNLQLGSAAVRSESVSHLRGEGGRSEMLSLALTLGRQELDQRTFQIHEVPHTSSDLLYKVALDDVSRSIFSGVIRVNPGAHQTDAYQKVRNLLLSDEAEATSAPGLEIEADDVRCTHGATTGQIDEEELFYLLSRGIPRNEAQKLFVDGFLQEVIARLGHEALGDALREKVHAKCDSNHHWQL
jgi:Fe-S cluster assembly protein SufD